MIEFHFTYFLFAFILILSGYFSNLIIISLIIIIHELGHFIIAKLLGFHVKKIIIYPYGGLTLLDDVINKNIDFEFLVSIAGILFQLIFFTFIFILYKLCFVRFYIYNLFCIYNFRIVFLNLLPIYPLDGSKILKCFLEKIFPFKFANNILIYFSFSLILIFYFFLIYNHFYSYIFILSVLFCYSFNFYKNRRYLYNRFLLERYLYKIKYNDIKLINNFNKMYKNKSHIIKNGNKYIKEMDFLNNMFD